MKSKNIVMDAIKEKIEGNKEDSIKSLVHKSAFKGSIGSEKSIDQRLLNHYTTNKKNNKRSTFAIALNMAGNSNMVKKLENQILTREEKSKKSVDLSPGKKPTYLN